MSRRRFLAASSSAFLVAGCGNPQRSGPRPPAEELGYASVADVMLDEPFYVAHRGSYDNWPEHTTYAYSESVAAGARAIDVSVSSTADGVLVCHHDENLQRMTGKDLVIAEAPYAQVEPLRNDARQWLGPAAKLQPIALLADVLDAFAWTHVIFIEDKQGTNTKSILELMDRFPDSQSRFVWKQNAADRRHVAAAERGYRTWGYLEEDAYGRIGELATEFDYLGISHAAPDEIVRRVVAQGKVVICWSIHTRAMRDRMLRLGVSGMMCSNIPYVTSNAAQHTSDSFGTGIRAAGDLPWTTDRGWAVQPAIDPSSATITLSGVGATSYCMGSMCPVARKAYSLGFQMRWPEGLPGDSEHAGIAFGQASDAPYRIRSASEVGGYHLVVRASGDLELYRREAGQPAGTFITRVRTDAPQPGQWMRFRVILNPKSVDIARTDATGWRTVVLDSLFRGGYFSLTKNYPDGPDVQFRSVVVT